MLISLLKSIYKKNMQKKTIRYEITAPDPESLKAVENLNTKWDFLDIQGAMESVGIPVTDKSIGYVSRCINDGFAEALVGEINERLLDAVSNANVKILKDDKAMSDGIAKAFGMDFSTFGHKAIKFYYMGICQDLSLSDLDNWAWLNTLLGYKISWKSTQKIIHAFNDIYGIENIQELKSDEKTLRCLRYISGEYILGLQFDKYIISDETKPYSYDWEED